MKKQIKERFKISRILSAPRPEFHLRKGGGWILGLIYASPRLRLYSIGLIPPNSDLIPETLRSIQFGMSVYCKMDVLDFKIGYITMNSLYQEDCEMLGTVIIDAYRKEEALEMVNAIDDLCSPTDNYGWASAGIYCFWDYYAEAILYIGLAGDLAERFRQHNGILPVKEGSKQKQIEDYFSKNERLGYTIFVQSPLSQPLVHRNRGLYEKFAKQQNSPVEDMLSEQGRDDIKHVEGILIESFRKNMDISLHGIV